MSSRRALRGGRWISMVLSLKRRSCRNRAAATSSARSALVAERIRTSTCLVREDPTRSNSPDSTTRSSLVCRGIEMLAISSRNSVPPSASSKRPTRSVLASVNAPRTWPNSSLSKTPSDSPPAFTVTSGLAERVETACSACATAPLPVPFSPVMSTFASDGPTRAISCKTGCIAADCAMICGPRSVLSSRFSASSRCPCRKARLRSTCVRKNRQDTRVVPGLAHEIARAPAHGFHGDVHRAPGGHHDNRERGIGRLDLRKQVEPLFARGRVPGVVEVHQDSVVFAIFDGLQYGCGRGHRVALVAFRLEQQPERLEDVRLIVGNENARGHGAQQPARRVRRGPRRPRSPPSRLPAGRPGLRMRHWSRNGSLARSSSRPDSDA